MEDLVHVYRNLHKKCYSIRKKGKVVAHRESVLIENPTFVVQPAGRARVLREKKKNVHAYVKGKWVTVTSGKIKSIMFGARKVRYNPYLGKDFFYTDGDQEPVFGFEVSKALLTPEGVWVC